MNFRKFQIIGLILLLIQAGIMSCTKGEEEEVDPMVGTYVFTSAKFNGPVTIIIQDTATDFISGDDASQFVGPGLLGAAPCANSQNAAVDLRKNGTAFYTCLNEANEVQMGTWSVDTDRTVLSINISNPMPFALRIVNLKATSNSFSGTVENFPLPLDTAYEIGASIPGTGLNYQTASVDVNFTKASK